MLPVPLGRYRPMHSHILVPTRSCLWMDRNIWRHCWTSTGIRPATAMSASNVAILPDKALQELEEVVVLAPMRSSFLL